MEEPVTSNGRGPLVAHEEDHFYDGSVLNMLNKAPRTNRGPSHLGHYNMRTPPLQGVINTEGETGPYLSLGKGLFLYSLEGHENVIYTPPPPFALMTYA
jgi:hypothetical protein